MSVLIDLSEDHQLIHLAMDRLDELARAALAGQALDEAELDRLRELIEEFVLGTHHDKEGALFDGLEGHGFRRQGGALGMLAYEHEAFREALGRVDRATATARIGDRWALATWGRQVDALVTLVRTHMAKEDEVLFPMARSRTPVEVLEGIGERVRELVAERHSGVRERWSRALHEPGDGKEAQ